MWKTNEPGEDGKAKGTGVDGLYAMGLLESTGICVVDGFGQAGPASGRLPARGGDEDRRPAVKEHHEMFLAKYA